MAQKITQLLIICLLISVSACSSTSKNIAKITVGKGTVRGNEIMISQIKFDDQWKAPGGSAECCWQQAGGTMTKRNVPFPKKVSVVWSDLSQRRIYFTDVALDYKKGEEFAQNVPPFYYHTGEAEMNLHPYIIVGFGENGEVKVWVSNVAYRDYEGRVIHEIGTGQAKWNPFPKHWK